MKNTMISILLIILLTTIVWNELNKSHEHQEFFNRVDSFINEGGRNTAKLGYDLCKRHEFLEAEYRHHHGQVYKFSSCEDIYGIEEPENKERFEPFEHLYPERKKL